MSAANRPVSRPLSPHLQIYRWQLTIGAVDPASCHRYRALGRRALSRDLGDLRRGTSACYAHVPGLQRARSRAASCSAAGCSAPFYHLCNGIRHLFWDAGYGFELKDAYRSGWIVVVVSLIATALSWVVGLG